MPEYRVQCENCDFDEPVESYGEAERLAELHFIITDDTPKIHIE